MSLINTQETPIGKILLEMGAITEDDLELALKEQSVAKLPLEKLMVNRGYVTEEHLAKALSIQTGCEYVTDIASRINPEIVGLVPESLAKKIIAIPLRKQGDELLVAMVNPNHIYNIEDLGYATNCRIVPAVATEKRIKDAIEKFYKMNVGLDLVSHLIDGIEVDHVEVLTPDIVNLEKILDLEVDAPIIKLVNWIFIEAIQQRATDVHIEPDKTTVRVRFRIDGILREIIAIPKKMQNAVASRIKIMSDLDVSERRMPQDGRMLIRAKNGNEVDVRLNIVPTVHGEKISLRLLNQTTDFLNAVHSNASEKNSDPIMGTFLELIRQSSGLFLVVGPTGQGKSTILYTALSELNDTSRHIITIEDPVEYQMPGLNQIQVNQKIGRTFANGLRAILRQDPNVIMIGEIRDRETCEITLEASLTGHVVFSTVHAEDTSNTIARLINMGIDTYVLACSLSAILSCRLVRLLCPHCKEPFTPSESVLKNIPESLKLNKTQYQFFRPVGCEKCRRTGYNDRTSILELMVINSQIRNMIIDKTPAKTIKQTLQSLGMKTLWENGWQKIVNGLTSIEEVKRVLSQSGI